MVIKLLKLAQVEIEEAVTHYESEQIGPGDRFRSEVLRSISRIRQFPIAYQQFSPGTRRCLIAKFPYGIIYHFSPEHDEIVIWQLLIFTVAPTIGCLVIRKHMAIQ